jgi:hypothetical protein
MRRPLSAALVLLALAGCAATERQETAPDPAPASAGEGVSGEAVGGAPERIARRSPADGAVLEAVIRAPPSLARRRVEELAVTCWLDDELSAGLMLVDRNTGEIVIAAAEGEILRIGFREAGTLETAVALAGPALAVPGRRARMADALSRVMEGAEPAC